MCIRAVAHYLRRNVASLTIRKQLLILTGRRLVDPAYCQAHGQCFVMSLLKVRSDTLCKSNFDLLSLSYNRDVVRGVVCLSALAGPFITF